MMSAGGDDPVEEYRRRRDRLVRQATLYSAGFFVAAAVIALAGAAAIAWVLARFGLPFRTTWLVIAACVIVVPVGIHAYTTVVRRRRSSGGEGTAGGRREREDGRKDGG
ncbi:MAG: hypothetical protein ACOC8B_00590 [Gemmatimonadota bacterium]